VKRIDYIFTRRSDRLRVKRPRIISTAASDHLPLVADIQIR
jgi:endonuclease/exonuclease/phosphatase family metal-dependent hydrolase